MVRAAVIFGTAIWAAFHLSPVAAQELAVDVAYVETVSGRVVALSRRGSPVLVGDLDVVDDRTRFDLLAKSELRLCHYGLRRFVTMKGPARVTVSADAIKVEAGTPVEISQETCSVAHASKFQGGTVARGIK